MHAVSTSQIGSGSTTKIEGEMLYANDSDLGSMSGTVAVTLTMPSASPGVAVGCTSFFGVTQAAPEAVGTYNNGSGGGAPGTLTVNATTAGDLIVDNFAGGYTISTTGKTASPNTMQFVGTYRAA